MGAAFTTALVKIGFSVAAASAIANLANVILLNVIMGALARSKNRRPANNVPPINVTVRDPIDYRRIIFGRRRVGGSITFFGSTGDNKKFLHYIVTLAGHDEAELAHVWRPC